MLLALLSDLTGPNVRFTATDNHGAVLDGLKIEQAGKGRYLGVSHALLNGRFELRLTESRDLRHWKLVRRLDEHAHQGTLRRFGTRWFLAWEKDGPNGNWIRVAEFRDEKSVRGGKLTRQFDIPRTLSKFAEGTPNLLGFDSASDRLKVGFHYYRDGDVDRQAEGELVGFRQWTAAPRAALNRFLEPDFRGNIGDRDVLEVAGKRYEILEAQLRKNDWSSWRILLSEGGGVPKMLSIKSPGGSVSFANPALTRISLPDGHPGVFGSYFLPSEGNARGEAGSCLFWFALS
jgi:hypothetical protein